MLIEFSVANFKSIRDLQTLSLVADSDKSLPENVIEPDIPGMKDVRLLKSAVIYGANAAGKTNLHDAIAFMRNYVANSSDKKMNDRTGVVPFLLDEKFHDKPSIFEVIFAHKGVRYQYGFSLDFEVIHEEWLMAYPSGKTQEWFRRKLTNKKTLSYEWDFKSRNFKGAKQSIANETRENQLLLSKGMSQNNEQLSEVYQWFAKGLMCLVRDMDILENLTARRIMNDIEMKSRLLKQLHQADTGIMELKVEKKDFDAKSLPDNMPEELKDSITQLVQGSEHLEVFTEHKMKGSDKGISFPFGFESNGTRKLFALLGPLLDSFDNNVVLFIDEIAANMHPHLARGLVKMFSKSNSTAQTILTTHETRLLDKELLRRDQIWFAEKDAEGATHLYPLSDYHPRKDESLDKGYLAGRYGGIPFLSGDFEF